MFEKYSRVSFTYIYKKILKKEKSRKSRKSGESKKSKKKLKCFFYYLL
jgi:hypothetical protein